MELAHETLTGQFSPFWQIAARLYDTHGSQRAVTEEILRLYRVAVSEKTAGLWINRGIEERKRELAEAAR